MLPESLPPAARRPFEWRRANPLGSLRLLRSHPELGGLAGVSFLASLAHNALPAIFVLYAMYRYNWNASAVGLTLAAVGVTAAVVQGTMVGPLVRKVGERRTLMCFNRADSKLFWQAGVTAKEKVPTHGTNPYCSASPVTDGERAVPVDRVSCLPIWRTAVSLPIDKASHASAEVDAYFGCWMSVRYSQRKPTPGPTVYEQPLHRSLD